MTRLSRLILGAALVSGAACSGGSPTAPASNRISPDLGVPLMFEGDTTACRSGWNQQNGKAC